MCCRCTRKGVCNEQLTVGISCAKDEGGPLGIGFQEQVPNQSKLLRSKKRGGERWIKSPNKIRAGEHSRDEREQTLGDASKGFRHCQNQRRSHPLGQICRLPGYWADGSRRIGGVKRMQAFAWNCRNQSLDAKGEVEAAKTAKREYRSQGLGRTDLYER